MARGDDEDFEDEDFIEEDAEAQAVEGLLPPNYEDYVAQRADAFGFLMLRADRVTDPELRELAMVMLKTMIRSVKTVNDGTLLEIK